MVVHFTRGQLVARHDAPLLRPLALRLSPEPFALEWQANPQAVLKLAAATAT
ncbi:MAG: hypothetical protein VKO00_11180 [Cyanobacteriota bacterium]|nr:hypothetical protein [Cyanobacteriota bacterium]